MTMWGPTDIDTGVLTGIMRAWGALPVGEIVSLQGRRTGAFNSRAEHVKVSYSADAAADAPMHLVVKRNGAAEWSIQAGVDEVEFYETIATLPNHPPVIPECFGAHYDPASRESYVVLRDLSDTHKQPVTRDQQMSIVNGLPSAADIDAVVDALAMLHAYWWQPGTAVSTAAGARWQGDWGFEE
jgi:hypothetical protein